MIVQFSRASPISPSSVSGEHSPSRLRSPEREESESADWDSLMVAAQAGHGGAYRRLLEQIGIYVRCFYMSRLPQSMLEDTVQETLIAIHEKRHTYDPSRPVRHWVAAIARYKWIDRIRALRTAPTESLAEDLASDDQAPAIASAAILDRLLDSIKPAQARVIRLVKIDGFSIEEAAKRTGQSPSLVKVNIHRGLARLAALARREDYANE